MVKFNSTMQWSNTFKALENVLLFTNLKAT